MAAKPGGGVRMLKLGELCIKCLCASCGYRKYCTTMEGATDMYCKEYCRGNEGCMNICNQYETEKQED